ncbi:hypothetical protein WA026_001013 [Henosepilachna vigintioctopunctata]|uniref:Uncharacterized protein n=1 Tax=Henosepilachna vigintioctopunctata TaxID=420089 RepID=A0AAW1V6S6_9CUCU
MSLTTAVSDEDDGESIMNSPYKAKQTGTAAASFNCTGAVRKAGGFALIFLDFRGDICCAICLLIYLRRFLEALASLGIIRSRVAFINSQLELQALPIHVHFWHFPSTRTKSVPFDNLLTNNNSFISYDSFQVQFLVGFSGIMRRSTF